MIPSDGRILLLDDSIEEAKPVLMALAREGAPVVYFSGRQEQLPDQPLKNIRLAILDLKLESTATDEKTVLATVGNCLRKLISSQNGPYILLVWSKHDNHYLDGLKKLFDSQLSLIRPTTILSLDKADVLKSNGDEKEIAWNIVQKKIFAASNEFGPLNILFSWENAIHLAAGITTNEFTNMYPFDEEWKNNIANLLGALAKASVGDDLSELDFNGIIQYALMPLSDCFQDNLEVQLNQADFTTQKFDIELGKDIDLLIKAKIHSKIHLRQGIVDKECPSALWQVPQNVLHPDWVFDKFVNSMLSPQLLTQAVVNELIASGLTYKDIYTDNHNLKSCHRTALDTKRRMAKEQAIPVIVEITPSCDYAHRKHIARRVIYGIMLPEDYLLSSDAFYKLPPLWLTDKIQYICLNLRSLSTFSSKEYAQLINNNDIVLLGCLREQITADIRNHAGRHVNRSGICAL